MTSHPLRPLCHPTPSKDPWHPGMRDRPLESAHMPYEPATNQASRIWNPSQPFLTRMWAYLFSLVICPVVSSTASVLQHGMEVVRGKVSKPAKGPGSPPRAAPLAPDAAVPVLPPEERPRPAETPRRSVKLPDGLGRYFEEVQYPAVASTSGSAPNAKARPGKPRIPAAMTSLTCSKPQFVTRLITAAPP